MLIFHLNLSFGSRRSTSIQITVSITFLGDLVAQVTVNTLLPVAFTIFPLSPEPATFFGCIFSIPMLQPILPAALIPSSIFVPHLTSALVEPPYKFSSIQIPVNFPGLTKPTPEAILKIPFVPSPITSSKLTVAIFEAFLPLPFIFVAPQIPPLAKSAFYNKFTFFPKKKKYLSLVKNRLYTTSHQDTCRHPSHSLYQISILQYTNTHTHLPTPHSHASAHSKSCPGNWTHHFQHIPMSLRNCLFLGLTLQISLRLNLSIFLSHLRVFVPILLGCFRPFEGKMIKFLF